MQLPVLQAPTRNEPGCVARFVQTVELGEGLGQAKLIVSGCQKRRLDAGLEEQIAALRKENLSREKMQQRLQSWIDGGSPCDQPFADPADRVSWEQAMADEMAYHGGDGRTRMLQGLLLMVAMGPNDEEYQEYRAAQRRRYRRAALFYLAATLFFITALGLIIFKII